MPSSVARPRAWELSAPAIGSYTRGALGSAEDVSASPSGNLRVTLRKSLGDPEENSALRSPIFRQFFPSNYLRFLRDMIETRPVENAPNGPTKSRIFRVASRKVHNTTLS